MTGELTSSSVFHTRCQQPQRPELPTPRPSLSKKSWVGLDGLLTMRLLFWNSEGLSGCFCRGDLKPMPTPSINHWDVCSLHPLIPPPVLQYLHHGPSVDGFLIQQHHYLPHEEPLLLLPGSEEPSSRLARSLIKHVRKLVMRYPPPRPNT